MSGEACGVLIPTRSGDSSARRCERECHADLHHRYHVTTDIWACWYDTYMPVRYEILLPSDEETA